LPSLRALTDLGRATKPDDAGNSTVLVLWQGQEAQVNWVRSYSDTTWEFAVTNGGGEEIRSTIPKNLVEVQDAGVPGVLAITSQLRAFLDTIAVAEGTSGPSEYRTCFSGELCVDRQYHDHPRIVHCVGTKCSDAAGRYQIGSATWDSIAEFLSLPDFSPANQDLAAVELLRRRRCLSAIERGDIHAACIGTGQKTGAARQWPSLPPGYYGDGAISFEEAEELFVHFGGKVAFGKLASRGQSP